MIPLKRFPLSYLSHISLLSQCWFQTGVFSDTLRVGRGFQKGSYVAAIKQLKSKVSQLTKNEIEADQMLYFIAVYDFVCEVVPWSRLTCV